MNTKIEEIWSDNYLIWKIRNAKLFRKDKKKYVKLCEGLIRKAQNRCVDRFIFVVRKDIPYKEVFSMLVPSKKEMKRKDKEGEFEERQGRKGQQKLFGDESLIKVYSFALSNSLKPDEEGETIDQHCKEAKEAGKEFGDPKEYKFSPEALEESARKGNLEAEREKENRPKEDLSRFSKNIRELDL